MKTNCSLQHPRADAYDLKTKHDVCCACIDDSGACEEGTAIYHAYEAEVKRQEAANEEHRQKLIREIQIQQEELAHPTRIQNRMDKEEILGKLEALNQQLNTMQTDANLLAARTEILTRKTNRHR
jgi:hypothetical protein